MTARDVLQLGESVLREVCQPVLTPASERIREVVNDLRDTLEETRRKTGYGRGIAAPQIGVPLRVVYLSARVTGKELVLLNPRIVAHSEETIEVWDSCLCFLSIFMRVKRYREITVEYTDLEGISHILVAGAENDLAELLQHEIDHLDGVLCVDLVDNPRDMVAREVFERDFRSASPYAVDASKS